MVLGEEVVPQRGWLVTLASAGWMLARRSHMVLEGMQPAERITSGRAWGQAAMASQHLQIPTHLGPTQYQPLGGHSLQQRG